MYKPFVFQGWMKILFTGMWQPVCAANTVVDTAEMLAKLAPEGKWSTTLVLPFKETPFLSVNRRLRKNRRGNHEA